MGSLGSMATPRAASTTERPALTRARVVAAALELADQEGLERLSMRRLATELGVEAMSLYHHVADKSDLYDAMVGAVLDEVELPIDGTWAERVEAIAGELRRVSLAHSHAHQLVLTRGFRVPAVLRPADALLEALRSSGMSDAEAVRGFWTLLSYVMGSVGCQLAEQPADGEDPDGADTCAAGVVPPAYPNVEAVADLLFVCDFDAQFEHGVATVLSSLTG